jgi:hypothetical protein
MLDVIGIHAGSLDTDPVQVDLFMASIQRLDQPSPHTAKFPWAPPHG